MSLFTAANNGLNLTPGQRAFLKVLKGIVVSAIMAGVTAAWPLLQSQAINWRTVATTGGVALAFTLFTALDKYWTSQGDAPLAAVAGSIVQALPTAGSISPPVASPQPILTPPAATTSISTSAPATTTTAPSNI